MIYNHRPIRVSPLYTMDVVFILLLVFAYLCGSISTAVIVCRILTLPDPRVVGSHNPGATNVLRIGGNKAALATLIGDVLKTVLPIGIGMYLGFDQVDLAWIGTCALLGHCFPIFSKFQGGKGVACMFAVLLLVAPRLFLLAGISWILIAWTFKRSSLASLLTAFIVPIFAYRFSAEIFPPLCALAIVIFIRHHQNIKNLLSGREPILSDKSDSNDNSE